MSSGEKEINTCLVNSLVAGIYMATREHVVEKDIRSVIVGMRGRLRCTDYMDPMQEDLGADLLYYDR